MEKVPIAFILDIFYVEELQDICRSFNLNAAGNKYALIESIIQNVRPVNKIIENLTVEGLKMVCSALKVKTGNKAQMQKILLELLDHEKTGLEKLSPTSDNVISKLKECILDKRRIRSEKDAEEQIGNFLSMYFRDVMSQYKLGGYIGLKIDLDINNGEFGVEVKLADSFLNNNSEVFRVFGQAVYYSKKQYGENFLVAVVGTEHDLDEPIVREAMSFLNSISIKWLGVIIR